METKCSLPCLQKPKRFKGRVTRDYSTHGKYKWSWKKRFHVMEAGSRTLVWQNEGDYEKHHRVSRWSDWDSKEATAERSVRRCTKQDGLYEYAFNTIQSKVGLTATANTNTNYIFIAHVTQHTAILSNSITLLLFQRTHSLLILQIQQRINHSH